MNQFERNLFAFLEQCVEPGDPMPNRVDANQREIVATLRCAGCTVQILSDVGKGCPDLLVGYDGDNFLFEVKDGSKTPSKRQLTPDEQVWHGDWDGQVCIVLSAEDALRVIGLMEEVA